MLVPLRALAFAAVLLTALSLVPTWAHVLEIGAKLGLGRDDYLVAQRLYRGWDLTGIVLVLALAGNAVLAFRLRGVPGFGWAADRMSWR